MPTQQVGPECHEHLQEVAGALLKARKVIVMTGAGISTNSGIPDFRSENGLYSLIQAQFDAATRQKPTAENDSTSDRDTEDDDIERAPKRRRVSTDDGMLAKDDGQDSEDKENSCVDLGVEHLDALPKVENSTPNTPTTTRVSLPLPLATTPRSSPPAHLVLPPSAFHSCAQHRFSNLEFPPSSSPLSSPPPVLFDPYEESSTPSESSPSHRSSTSQSDPDDSFALPPPSQPKSNLPNMKGKDLFDASIWADPLRTSVFYTFATSLRQKIRDCEPTSSHRFISHLRDRGKLVRCYTQNIDQIEEKVGLSTSLEDGPGSRGRFSRRSTANTSQLSKMVEEVSDDKTSNDTAQDASTTNDAPASRRTTDGPRSLLSNTLPEHGPLTEEQHQQQAKTSKAPPKLERSKSGVECVFLHGSLESLRCFQCGRISSWDDTLASETLSGQQPECPHCIGATTARQERGKRALGVGKLRPDIVLYGEEHPNAHLISPIITHDISLCPDLLLILGTSLRVHGLKVLVREFAKAIHNRGGKVVFVNFTKPSESSWGDVIDYWVQWDCDAWVSDLQSRVPRLWEDEAPPRRRKTDQEKEKERQEKEEEKGRQKQEKTEERERQRQEREEEKERQRQEREKERQQRPPPANPAAKRDTKLTGAYWSLKIRDELFRLTGTPSLQWRAYEPLPKNPNQTPPASGTKSDGATGSVATTPELRASSAPAAEPSKLNTAMDVTVETHVVQMEVVQTDGQHTPPPPGPPPPAGGTIMNVTVEKSSVAQRATKPKAPRRTRKSAGPSTLNPHHGRDRKPKPLSPAVERTVQGHGLMSLPDQTGVESITSILSPSSIIDSVKGNARTRKRKKIDGEEVVLPTTKTRAVVQQPPRAPEAQQQQGPREQMDSLTLAPLSNVQPSPTHTQMGVPQPMEPLSPPPGPVSRLTASISNIFSFSFLSSGAPSRAPGDQTQTHAQQGHGLRNGVVTRRQARQGGYGGLEADTATTLGVGQHST